MSHSSARLCNSCKMVSLKVMELVCEGLVCVSAHAVFLRGGSASPPGGGGGGGVY